MTEPERELFLRQKRTLDLFLKNGSITKRQYNRSYGDLCLKMGAAREEPSWFLLKRSFAPDEREMLKAGWSSPGWEVCSDAGSVSFRDAVTGELVWLLSPGDGEEHVVITASGTEERDRERIEAVLSRMFQDGKKRQER